MSPADRGSEKPGGDARERIDAEHRLLAETLRQIERAPDAEALLPLLARLSLSLAAHFAAEEAADGLHEAVRSMAPRHVAHVDAVLAEHVDLRSRLADLLVRGATTDWPTLHAATIDFVERMRAHEGRENELFDDSVMRDVGAGD